MPFEILEDIDFSYVRDKIFNVLCAPWTLVVNVCVVLWSYVSQAFWAMWTNHAPIAMPLTFNEDTNWRDKIFHALWTFLVNVCVVIWSCVSQAFWAMWTYHNPIAMPFTFNEDTDWRGKILDILRALWALVVNVCIMLWSYVSQAFGTMWTNHAPIAMPLTFDEDTNWIDKIFNILCALWTFVFNVCIVLWSYVSQVFWAMWTYHARIVMPLTFNEDTNWRDKIFNILCVLWTLVLNVCIVLWSYVSQAFWSTFAAALIGLMGCVSAHPFIAVVIFVLAFILTVLVLRMSLLYCLGFRRRGILRGSRAARYQATRYGGNVPRGSTFASLQSQGAKGG